MMFEYKLLVTIRNKTVINAMDAFQLFKENLEDEWNVDEVTAEPQCPDCGKKMVADYCDGPHNEEVACWCCPEGCETQYPR